MRTNKASKAFALQTIIMLFWAGATFMRIESAARGRPAQPATQRSAADVAFIRSIQCQDHLHKIHRGLLFYVNDHTGKFPPDLGTLLVAQKMDLSDFVCPAAPSALPDHWQNLPPDKQAKWVNSHSDYVFPGANSNLGEVDLGKPLVYEKDDDQPSKVMYILFGDGHVEVLKLDEVHQRFGPKAGAERATTRVAPLPGQPPAIPLITIDQAYASVAQAQINYLKTAIVAFEIDNGRFPTTQEGLSALVKKPAGDLPDWKPYLDTLPKDPWGHPYVYKSLADKGDVEIFSCGPDGKPYTEDDVKAE